jgi:anti-anti-sigma factor
MNIETVVRKALPPARQAINPPNRSRTFGPSEPRGNDAGEGAIVLEYRFVLRGEIDLAEVPNLRIELRRAVDQQEAHVLIDAADVTFIDSAAVAALLEAHQMLQHQGRNLLVVNVSPFARRTFEVLGVTDLLRYDPDTFNPA